MIAVGQQFGLYVIKDLITDHGQRHIYRAEDPFFNREVTLHLIPKTLFGSENKLEQLELQFEQQVVLEHPSIAPFFDTGIEGDFFYYTTVGATHTNLNPPVDAETALKILVELAQALRYAQLQGVYNGRLGIDQIGLDSSGRAIIHNFGVDLLFKQVQQADESETPTLSKAEKPEVITETLHSLGELLLQLLKGVEINPDQRIDDLVAEVEEPRLRKLVGRFLLPGEWRFADYEQLLEELANFVKVGDLSSKDSNPPAQKLSVIDPIDSIGDRLQLQQTEQAIAEVRRLVGQKNQLLEALDKAILEKNQAENKAREESRELATTRRELTKISEEAEVAWELVAGQKNQRWRPLAWTAGGFLLGFILSGSYGYYYSEQNKTELLAKLQANEELIRQASWQATRAQEAATAASREAALGRERAAGSERSAAPQTPPVPQVAADTVAAPEKATERLATHAVAKSESSGPVRLESQQWWPPGNEFSPLSAVPVEQIKAALGFTSEADSEESLSEQLRQEVLGLVNGWAESWAAQDVNGYLSYYSDEYRPELGRSRKEWKEIRRHRLTRPRWIKLNLEDIRLRQVDDDWIQVKLKQSYQSDSYQDEILKSLNLVREQGGWRIVMERSLGMVGDIVGG